MAAQTLIYVTGFKELDAKLRMMPAALQKKFVRGGLKKGSNRVARDANNIISAEARDKGALEQSVKTMALKRSRVRAGYAIMPKRDVLFAKYAAKHEGKQPHPAAGETDPFYYAAAIEFGTATQQAVRPFRRALYDNASVIRAYFQADIMQFIAENKVVTKLSKTPSGQNFTGKNFKK